LIGISLIFKFSISLRSMSGSREEEDDDVAAAETQNDKGMFVCKPLY